MKIAIVISGYMRNYEVYKNNFKRIFGKHDIDIFFYTSKYNYIKSSYKYNGIHKKVKDVTIEDLKNNYGTKNVKKVIFTENDRSYAKILKKYEKTLIKNSYAYNCLDQFLRLSKVLELCENSNNVYDYVIRYRPDIYIEKDLELKKYDKADLSLIPGMDLFFFGTPKVMLEYRNLHKFYIDYFTSNPGKFISAEQIFSNFLKSKKFRVKVPINFSGVHFYSFCETCESCKKIKHLYHKDHDLIVVR